MIKKHLLTKQKGIDSCSLLPQKWLVCLLTLLVTFVGSGRMLADEYTKVLYWGADGAEKPSDSKNEYNYSDGFSIQINNSSKEIINGNGFVSIEDKSYQTIKNSNGTQNIITLPDGMLATKVTFYVVTNHDSEYGKLSEINGVSCSDVVNNCKDYEHPIVIEKTLNDVSSFTFTFSEKQVCFLAVVDYKDAPPTFVLNYRTDGNGSLAVHPGGFDQYTNVNIANGDALQGGTVFTMVTTPNAGYVADGITGIDASKVTEGTEGGKVAYRVSMPGAATTITANFIKVYNVSALSNGIGGSVNLYVTGDGTKTSVSGQTLKKNVNVTAEATASTGYHFVRWDATGSNQTAPVQVTTETSFGQKIENLGNSYGEDIVLTAVFEKDDSQVVIEKVTWNAENRNYNAGDELSTNLDVVSVKLGTGTWEGVTAGTNNTFRGITNHVQGPGGIDGAEMGAYIVVRPTVNIDFKTYVYASQSNCRVAVYDVETNARNTLSGQYRIKAEQVVNGDVLYAGHTYYIYAYNFAASPGGLEYLHFINFTADPIHPITNKNTLGLADGSSDFASVFTPYYEVTKSHEREFTFTIHRGSTDLNPWNSFFMQAYTAQDPATEVLTLRADNFGWGSAYNGGQDNLALKGGVLDWGTFVNDLDGAQVDAKISYNGEMLFVYWTITNNDRTYTYFYPTKTNIVGDNVYVAFSIDKSQITNFVAKAEIETRQIVTVVRDGKTHTDRPEMGNVVITNDDGVNIPSGASLGVGTNIHLTATANEGYLFAGWTNSQTNTRDFEVGSNDDATVHTFYAYFNDLSDYETTYTMTKDYSDLYIKKENDELVKWDNTTNNGVVNGCHTPETTTFSGAYNNEGVENPGTKGLLFNNKVAKMNSRIGFRIDAGTGIIKVPVKAGEIVTISAENAGGTKSFRVVNSDGDVVWFTSYRNNVKSNTIIAATDGYINIENGSDADIYITNIKKSLLYEFTFADGTSVAAMPGTSDYVNNVAAVSEQFPLLDGATYIWTSSNPSEVRVEPYSGRITVNENFSGNVKITATRLAMDNYPTLAKSYNLITTTNRMYFDPASVTVELEQNNTKVYVNDVKWQKSNDIPAANIIYSIVSTTARGATATPDDEGHGTSEITVTGKGRTVVKASCGALSATYELNTYGFVFDIAADTYDFSGSYQQTITDASYEIIQKHGAIKDVDLNIDGDGVITGFSSYDDNMGGAIVVQATNNNNSSEKATYTLTIPYKKYYWDFYNENQTANVTEKQVLANVGGHSHYTMGDLAPANPHAASEVPADAVIPNDGTGSFPGQYITNYSDTKLVTSIKKQLNWKNNQEGELANGDAHKYWNYVFKTQSHQDKKSYLPIDYCNEELFAYKNAVNGDNVRIINDTQGLIFTTGANGFGMNDSHFGYDLNSDWRGGIDGRKTAEAVREMDRAILLLKDGSLTIPYVTAGHFVKIHWYRHSTNAGDMFSVTNARDLDGTEINPNHRIQFTGSHYEGSNGYFGLTILQAKENGPMTITANAKSSWIEIYTIELTDEYKTELSVQYANVWQNNNYEGWGGPMASGYTDGNMVDMHTNVINVVRDVRCNDSYSESDLCATDYGTVDDKNKNRAKYNNCAAIPTERSGRNPLIYIGSFPGYTNGWNGWNLDVDCQPVPEDEYKLTIGLQKALYTRVGNSLTYGVHAITNFKGTGTAHVIVRTKSGGVDGGPRYTLDMQEAYFPVGEYNPQEYPYTWDFTDYNINGTKPGSNGIQYRNMTTEDTNNTNVSNYGGWNNEKKLTTHASVSAQIPLCGAASNHRGYNKFLFADGSQLTMNQNSDDGANYIRETEGLRVNLNGGTTEGNSYNNATAVTMDGSMLNVNGTITIPEVEKNMYIFVRSTNKPTNVVGAEDMSAVEKIEYVNVTYSTFDNNVEVALKKGDIPSNVWIYKQTNEDKTDVVITPDGAIEAIGVTNYMKPMVQFKNMPRATYTTDAREERIDYHNTGIFTNHDLKAYVANQDAVMKSDDPNSKDSENGTITLTDISVVPAQGASLDGNRGIMLEDEVREPKAGETNTARPLLPLFVPACNLPDESLKNNKLIGCITEQTIPASSSTTMIYTLTNQYYDWDWASKKEAANPEHHVASDASFYINRSAITSRKHCAYLSVPVPQQSSVKQIYMIFGEGDEDMDEPTAIEGIELNSSDNMISEPVDVYTLTGVKLNGMPTQKGVYVINGKKVLVK